MPITQTTMTRVPRRVLAGVLLAAGTVLTLSPTSVPPSEWRQWVSSLGARATAALTARDET